MPACVKLVGRRVTGSSAKPLRGVEVCALMFSLIVLLREYAMLNSSFHLTKLAFIPILAFMWGPLLVAFNALDEKEMSCLRLWMSIAGIVIGVWATLIYITNSSYLKMTAIWDPTSSDLSMRAIASESSSEIVGNRFVVMGLYSICSFAYWYVLRGALSTTKQHLLRNLVMWAGVGTIMLAFAISVTRGTILIIGSGTIIMLIAWARIKGLNLRDRIRSFAIIVAGACLLGVVVSRIDLSPITIQYQARFATLGKGESSVITRLLNTNNAWEYISQSLCLFGAPNPDSIASRDTAVVLRIWLCYGMLGAILFSVLFIISFWRLFKCGLSQRFNPEDQMLRGMLIAWALSYVYIWIVGYSLQQTEVFFTMLFFSEISRLNDKRLTQVNLRLRRVAT